MKKLHFFIAGLMAMFATSAFASDLLTLEHTFDGYYMPYNFPIVTCSDGEKYFMDAQPQFDSATNIFSTKTYNEDYSVRDIVNVKLQGIPSGYRVSNVYYSPLFKLGDGISILVVSAFRGTDVGKSDYCRCWVFNASTGGMISQIASSTGTCIVLNTIYEINGKRCFIVLKQNYGPNISYQTEVYSLGDVPDSAIKASAGEALIYPVEIYDLSGRVLDNLKQAAPSVKIVRMSDGSTVKTVGR